jgi:hypothetical protein
VKIAGTRKTLKEEVVVSGEVENAISHKMLRAGAAQPIAAASNSGGWWSLLPFSFLKICAKPLWERSPVPDFLRGVLAANHETEVVCALASLDRAVTFVSSGPVGTGLSAIPSVKVRVQAVLSAWCSKTGE